MHAPLTPSFVLKQIQENRHKILARACGVPVGRHSGGQLAEEEEEEEQEQPSPKSTL